MTPGRRSHGHPGAGCRPPAGEHVSTFRVVSADGHPVSGTVTFTTTGGPPASATPPASVARRPTATGRALPGRRPRHGRGASAGARRSSAIVAQASLERALGVAGSVRRRSARWPLGPIWRARRRTALPVPTRGAGAATLTDFARCRRRLLMSPIARH